jgi:hypothetical protein
MEVPRALPVGGAPLFFGWIGCKCGGLKFSPLKGRGFFFTEADSWSGVILLRLGLSSG